MLPSCRSNYTTEDDKGLACQILFAHEEALPTFIADTVKYKGEHLSGVLRRRLVLAIPNERIPEAHKESDSAWRLCTALKDRHYRVQKCQMPVYQHAWQHSGLFAGAEQGTGRTGHAKTREAIYKWMDAFLRSMNPQNAATAAAGAVEAIAVYGFRREADNYARAASLLTLQASLELKLPPWAMDRSVLQQSAIYPPYSPNKSLLSQLRAKVVIGGHAEACMPWALGQAWS